MGELTRLTEFEACDIEWIIWKGADEYLLLRGYRDRSPPDLRLRIEPPDDEVLRDNAFGTVYIGAQGNIWYKVFSDNLKGRGIDREFFAEVEKDLEARIQSGEFNSEGTESRPRSENKPKYVLQNSQGELVVQAFLKGEAAEVKFNGRQNSALLNYAMDHLREHHGVRTVYVTVKRGDVDFYQNFGFTRTRTPIGLGLGRRLMQPMYEMFRVTLEKHLE